MYCKSCGKEISDGKFCSYCGTQVDVVEEVKAKVVKEHKAKYSKKYIVWEIFSIIGYVFGVITFALSFFLPFVFIKYSIIGIVFSILGRKSYKNYEKAEVGIKLSTASIFVSAIMCVIPVIIFWVSILLLII